MIERVRQRESGGEILACIYKTPYMIRMSNVIAEEENLPKTVLRTTKNKNRH